MMKQDSLQSVSVLAMAACVQFVALTLIAMFFYPGGTLTDPSTEGYLFLSNFFSDLGTLESYNGTANTVSSVLFIVALTLAGLGLTLFFLNYPVLFQGTAVTQLLSLAGTVFGVITGLSYVGIAFTPADQFIALHTNFVYAAFSAFLAVVVCYTIAIYLSPDYPNRYGVLFLVFAGLLAGYLWLLFFGPGAATPSGMRIQAIGQKMIVYAAIIILFLQADGARRLVRQNREFAHEAG